MPVIPTRFPVSVGEVIPEGVSILGVQPTLEFSNDRHAPQRQERDKDTTQLVGTARALDAHVAFRFRATGMRAPGGVTSATTAPPSADTPARNAA